jgi:DUF1680 family protein
MRTVASWHNYLYSVDYKGLWIHHYGANVFNGKVADGTDLKLTQETDYPWDGNVRITLDKVGTDREFSIRVRIPGWAQNAMLKVNGKAANAECKPESYALIERKWIAGDVIELGMPMPVRMIVADPHIEHTRNQVAIMRGPIVYCLESIDLPEGVAIEDICLPGDAEWKIRYEPDNLGGVALLSTNSLVIEKNARRDIGGYRQVSDVRGRRVDVTMIPYYAWNNRDEPKMTIWLPVRW